MESAAKCGTCGVPLVADALFCARCGSPVRTDASVMAELPALRPEAEPPLPAEHESLRANRTPPRGEVATRVERLVTPERVPRIDSHERLPRLSSQPRLDPLERSPLSTVAPSPLLGVEAVELSMEPPAHSEIPSLTGSRRTGLIAVLLLIAVGATVGWLLSRDPPPTSDEVRARGMQQHPQ